MTAAVEADGLRIATRTRAIGPFHLEVAAGEVVGLVGPNGSGKTTLLRLVLGLDRASAGTSRVFGRLVDPWHPPAGVGAVFEADGWYPWLSGRQNLAVYAEVHGLGPAAVDGALDEVGLDDAADRSVRAYSRGMRQRLAIARAGLGDPALLILDEPTVALDSDAVEWLVQRVRRHVRAGGSAIVASHEGAVLDQVGARRVQIDRGRCR